MSAFISRNTNYVIKSWYLEHSIEIGPIGMPFVREGHEFDYLRDLRQVIARLKDFWRKSTFEQIREYDSRLDRRLL